MWLAMTVYYSMFKDFKICLIWIYFSSIFLCMFSYSSMANFIIGQLVVWAFVRIVTKNILYNIVLYFMGVLTASVILFYLTTTTLNFALHGLPYHFPNNLFLQTVQLLLVGVLIFM